eukprot:scaffold649_cov347-Pavlova_lutheri.AAC.47
MLQDASASSGGANPWNVSYRNPIRILLPYPRRFFNAFLCAQSNDRLRVRRQCLIRRPRSTQPLLRRSASFEELHRFHPQLRHERQQTCLLFPFSSFQTIEIRFHEKKSRIPPCSFHMRPFRHAPRGFSCLKALLPTAMGPPPPPSRGTCLPSGAFRPPSAHVASASGTLRCKTTRATPPNARDEPMDQWPTGIDAPLYGEAREGVSGSPEGTWAKASMPWTVRGQQKTAIFIGESRGRVGGLRTDRRRIEKAGKRTQYCSYARYKRTRRVGGTVRGRLRGVDPRMGFDGRADGTASTKRPPSRNGPSGYQRIPWPRRTIEFSTRGFWIPTRLMEWLRHLYQPRAELALVTFGPAMARLHIFSPSGATPMMQMSAATFMAFFAICKASMFGTSMSALAADTAYDPPEPIPMTPSCGSKTSPFPVICKDCCLSATTMTASSLRKNLSVLHNLASSTAARVNCPGCSSNLCSKRSKRVKASAVAPANPPITPSPILLTFLTFGFKISDPRVTCPSAIMTTWSSFRTHKTVVPRMPTCSFEGASAWYEAALPCTASVARASLARPSTPPAARACVNARRIVDACVPIRFETDVGRPCLDGEGHPSHGFHSKEGDQVLD